jgi:Mg-chelatase subunit ChlD
MTAVKNMDAKAKAAEDAREDVSEAKNDVAAKDAKAKVGNETKNTDLIFLLDCSGSMSGLEGDTIGGFNAVLKEHKELSGKATVSTILFNHETHVLHDRVDIEKVKLLTGKDYHVGGCTALLDAVGGAIRHTKMVHGYLPKEYRPEKTIVVIITDGMENSSKKYSYKDVKRLISKCEEKQSWDFLFLGANIDAAAEAERIGIAQSHAATYVADERGTEVVYGAVAAASCAMRDCGTSLSENWADDIKADHAARG